MYVMARWQKEQIICKLKIIISPFLTLDRQVNISFSKTNRLGWGFHIYIIEEIREIGEHDKT